MEFAFLDILPRDRRGLCTWAPARDRLAGILFRPNAKRSVVLRRLDLDTRRILLPLSSRQWQTLSQTTRLRLYASVERAAGSLRSRVLAVNRSLRLPEVAATPGDSKVLPVRGDTFIPALALAVAENEFGESGREKLWLVGDFPGMVPLISLTARLGIPVAVQTAHPSRLEPIAHRLMYEEGVAVSLGSFNPASWGKRDVVMIFEPAYLPFARDAAREWNIPVIDLTDDSTSLAPRLESELQEQGIDPSLKTTAPLLEAWLWTRNGDASGIPAFASRPLPGETSAAPFGDSHSGTANLLAAARKAACEISRFKEKGHQAGLWRFFLDKAYRALYNTFQGKGAVG